MTHRQSLEAAIATATLNEVMKSKRKKRTDTIGSLSLHVKTVLSITAIALKHTLSLPRFVAVVVP